MENSGYYKDLMEEYKNVKVSKVITTKQDENGEWSSKVEKMI